MIKFNFIKKRWFYIGAPVALLVIIGLIFAFSSGNNSNILTEQSKTVNLARTVVTSGKVTSTTDIKLSFKSSGFAKQINVKVGDKVKENTIIAALDGREQQASLTQARGSLASAQANYKKVLDGASSAEVEVAQVAVNSAQVSLDNAKKSLDNTKKQQDILVKNALSALVSSGLTATAESGNTGTAPTVSGSYKGSSLGEYRVSLYSAGGGIRYEYAGLENGGGYVSTGSPVPLGSNGLYLTFSVTPSTADRWVVELPNTQSSSYVANYNAYQAALETRSISVTTAESSLATSQSTLDSAIAALNLKKSEARPADIQAAQAQILSAQGQYQSAEAAYENTLIRAPAAGTITKVDIKVGELASSTQPVIVLQDTDNLHIEAEISESNIAFVQPGQRISVYFDALGADKVYSGSVLSVDPSSTIVSGIVNYKVVIGIDGDQTEIKPGMTANISIITAEKANVVVVPLRAIIEKEGKQFVRVITDSKKKTYEERLITKGLEGDGALVEVVSGLPANIEIVTSLEAK